MCFGAYAAPKRWDCPDVGSPLLAYHFYESLHTRLELYDSIRAP
jgi:hypothetical protein